MTFRTKIASVKSSDRISYQTPVMMLGSCFSDEIGAKFISGKMDVLVNPFGTLFNPLSVASELDIILEDRKFTDEDLFRYKSRYLSFSHDTSFSSTDSFKILDRINMVTAEAHHYLSKARYLFITFGTARVFRLSGEGRVVANCHKLPASMFERELLTVNTIVDTWSDLINRLIKFNSNIKIYFTVSPVRHWKDGAHGNQLSKAVLLLAIDLLIDKMETLNYIPSYELMMDDLRDYRFYSDDMLHPNRQAVDYIWRWLTDTHFDSDTLKIYNEVSKITLACKHRIISDNRDDQAKYGKTMKDRISDLIGRYPFLDLKSEIEYFRKIEGGSTG